MDQVMSLALGQVPHEHSRTLTVMLLVVPFLDGVCAEVFGVVPTSDFSHFITCLDPNLPGLREAQWPRPPQSPPRGAVGKCALLRILVHTQLLCVLEK